MTGRVAVRSETGHHDDASLRGRVAVEVVQFRGKQGCISAVGCLVVYKLLPRPWNWSPGFTLTSATRDIARIDVISKCLAPESKIVVMTVLYISTMRLFIVLYCHLLENSNSTVFHTGILRQRSLGKKNNSTLPQHVCVISKLYSWTRRKHIG